MTGPILEKEFSRQAFLKGGETEIILFEANKFRRPGCPSDVNAFPVENEKCGEEGNRRQSEVDAVDDPRDQPPLLLKHSIFRFECTSKRCLCDIRKPI